MFTPRKILVVITPTMGYQQRILSGVYEYARPLGWHFRKVPVLASPEIFDMLQEWEPDGLLMLSPDHRAVLELEPSVPWVQVGGEDSPGIRCHVGYENEQLGEIAAEHLLTKGIQSAVAIGNSERKLAGRRVSGCKRVLVENGVDPVLEFDEIKFKETNLIPHLPWISPYPPLIELFARMPKPLGVFGWQDSLCEWVLEQCYQNRIKVPDDLMVVGVNNEESICEMTFPTLSSVHIPFREAGRQAAHNLNLMIHGGSAPRRLRLSSSGLVARESSRRIPEEDSWVFSLLRLLKNHETCRWDMEEISSALGCSRRMLERRTRRALNRSVLDLRQEARLDYAKELLTQDLYSIEGVAKECGYDSVRSLQKLCREKLGCTPMQYRQKSRLEFEEEGKSLFRLQDAGSRSGFFRTASERQLQSESGQRNRR